jgi:hypothetical protein
VARQLEPQSLGDRVDRRIQHGVGERRDLAGLLVDRVVMVLVGVGDLEPRYPVAAVEPVQQPELEQAVQHPVDRRSRPLSTLGDPVDHILRGQQALALVGENLHHRPARRARTHPGAARAPFGLRQPPIACRRIHLFDDSQPSGRQP